MAEGEGFQIVTWDAINKEKRDKRAKKGEDYENSGTVILKSINIDRVSVIDPHFNQGTFTNYVGQILPILHHLPTLVSRIDDVSNKCTAKEN